MKTQPDRSIAAPPGEPMADGLWDRWLRFWFTPIDPTGLHVVRILAGLLFLAWLLPLAGHIDSLFGLNGWFDTAAYVDAERLQAQVRRNEGGDLFRPMSWSLLYLAAGNPQVLKGLYWGAVAILVLFTLGFWTRITSILTWIIVVSFTVSPVLEYDADAYLLFFAFYLMLGYAFFGQRSREMSLVGRLLGTRSSWWLGRRNSDDQHPSLAANVALRLLQVHFALVIVTTGLHKLQTGEWWSGVAFWFPNYPPFKASLEAARSHVGDRELYLCVLSIGAYAVLAWEIGFPLFAWKRGWRLLLIGGGAAALIGTSSIFGLPLIGPAMFIGCLSYLTADEWERIFGLATRLPGLNRFASEPPASPEAETLLAGEKEKDSSLVPAGERA